MAAPLVAAVWSLDPSLNQSDFLKMFSRRGGLVNLPVMTPDKAVYAPSNECGGGFVMQQTN
jgi:hypothetical protein